MSVGPFNVNEGPFITIVCKVANYVERDPSDISPLVIVSLDKSFSLL